MTFNSLADPKYLVAITAMYKKAMEEDLVSHCARISAQAETSRLPQWSLALRIGRTITANPPSGSLSMIREYFRENVLPSVPNKYTFDDVFWSCLLHAMDSSGIPECVIGGPLHNMIYEVHDDFHPGDVANG